MSDLDQRERRELCDLFDWLGPDAPTLCEGWTTADLAAHLVVRERDPIGAPGILLEGRLGPVGDRMARITEQHMARELERGFPAVIDRVRSGPPAPLSLIGPLRYRVNLAEYVIHHEDVRRANGEGPRTDRSDLDDAVWALLKPASKLLFRRARPLGITLRTPDGRTATAISGSRRVEIVGPPVELLLFGYGRPGQVELVGADEAVAAVRSTSFGL